MNTRCLYTFIHSSIWSYKYFENYSPYPCDQSCLLTVSHSKIDITFEIVYRRCKYEVVLTVRLKVLKSGY